MFLYDFKQIWMCQGGRVCVEGMWCMCGKVHESVCEREKVCVCELQLSNNQNIKISHKRWRCKCWIGKILINKKLKMKQI